MWGIQLVLSSLYEERRAHLCAQGATWDEGPRGDGDELGYRAFVYCYNVDLASFWKTMALGRRGTFVVAKFEETWDTADSPMQKCRPISFIFIL